MERLTSSEIKSIELNILKQFTDFCEENSLYYTLGYGTLLGAVRHKGFIPWDDDIDIFMPRKDYEKIVKMYKNGKSVAGLSLLYSTDENEYYYPFAKLCDPNTVAKMESNLTEHGIWIDIFPVDKVPEDRKQDLKFHKRIRFLKRVVISYTTDFKNRKLDKKTLPKLFLSVYGKIRGKKRITAMIEKEAVQYNNTDSSLVCPIVFQTLLGGEMQENDFLTPVKLQFEQYEFNAPTRYDEYLTSLYGNYMQLPPENKRQTHEIIAYKI